MHHPRDFTSAENTLDDRSISQHSGVLWERDTSAQRRSPDDSMKYLDFEAVWLHEN